jgi:hypothetical protein
MANNAEYEYLLKLVLIGNPKVEKSALLLRYVDDIWDDNIVPPNGRAELVSKILIYIFKLF